MRGVPFVISLTIANAQRISSFEIRAVNRKKVAAIDNMAALFERQTHVQLTEKKITTLVTPAHSPVRLLVHVDVHDASVLQKALSLQSCVNLEKLFLDQNLIARIECLDFAQKLT
jgi:hypothetical protein